MRKKLLNDNVLRTLTLLPSIILIAIFVYGFIGNTVWVSLTDWGTEAALSLTPEIKFTGLGAYKTLFTEVTDARFRQDIVNTFTYMVLIIGITIVIGMITAILLDREPKGENVFRTIFLYPMALSFVVTGTIWRWMLAPSGGINLIPKLFGMEPFQFQWISSRVTILQFNWQNVLYIAAFIIAVILALAAYNRWKSVTIKKSPLVPAIIAALLLLWSLVKWPAFQALPYEETHGVNLATLGVIIAAVWQYSGYTMAMFLAGLQGIPHNLHESARIDGATEPQYYFRIAIPMLKSTVLSAVIILSHVSLKIFALIFAMAGPDNAETGHPAVLMYLTTFRANDFAKGAAISIVLFLVASLFIIPYLVSSHRSRRG